MAALVVSPSVPNGVVTPLPLSPIPLAGSAGTGNLRTPGPTPLSASAARAMFAPVVPQSSDIFHRCYAEIQEGLWAVLRVPHPCLIVQGGGSGAMDAAVRLLAPGDAMAVLVNGAFGERFVDQGRRARLRVAELREHPGLPFGPEQVDAFLAGAPTVRAVFVVAHETSTGVANDLTWIAPLVHARCPDVLLVVDVVSLAPLHRFDPVAEGADALVVSSSKALMVPPGLGIVALSERGQEAARAAAMDEAPALDLGLIVTAHARGECPTTPPIPLFWGLAGALDDCTREGAVAFADRHARAAARVRSQLAALGLAVIAPPGCAAPTLTADRLPAGLSAARVRDDLERRHGVYLATGRGPEADRILRFAHMGAFTDAELDQAIAALDDVLVSQRGAATPAG